MNHYQIMRVIAAKERLGISLDVDVDVELDKTPKPSQPALFTSFEKKVRKNKTIIKSCPICGCDFRVTPCHEKYKTCRKSECVTAYRVNFMRRPQTYMKCKGKDCCNYLDSFYRQKSYCSRRCCSHASRKGANKNG